MANWKYTLYIGSVWNNEDLTIQEKGKAIAKKMKQTFPKSWLDVASESYDNELDDIVFGFENITGYDDISPVDEFDEYMEWLYDWADQEVQPTGQWARNAMCWVETIKYVPNS